MGNQQQQQHFSRLLIPKCQCKGEAQLAITKCVMGVLYESWCKHTQRIQPLPRLSSTLLQCPAGKCPGIHFRGHLGLCL